MPRIPFLAILADVIERKRRAALGLPGPPDHFVKALDPAMQMVLAIVPREPVLAAVQREPALRDPIAVTADDRAEVGRVVLQIALRVVETEHDIRQLAIAIRRFEGNKYAAVVRDPCLNSMGVRQRVKIDHLLIGRLSERLSLNARFGFRRPPWIPQWNEAKAQRQSQKKSVSIAHHRRLSRCCLCACHPSSRCISSEAVYYAHIGFTASLGPGAFW